MKSFLQASTPFSLQGYTRKARRKLAHDELMDPEQQLNLEGKIERAKRGKIDHNEHGPHPDKRITIYAAAKAFNVKPQFLYAHIRLGKLKAEGLRGGMLVESQAVRELVDSNVRIRRRAERDEIAKLIYPMVEDLQMNRESLLRRIRRLRSGGMPFKDIKRVMEAAALTRANKISKNARN